MGKLERRNHMTLSIKNGVFIIDDSDESLVKLREYKWYIDPSGYVVAWLPKERKFLRMHRLILGYEGPLEVDHINGIRHDNRRSNLRLVPHHINLHNQKLRTDNTNGFKGLFLNRSGNWGYQTWVKGVKHAKQGYKTKEEAYAAKLEYLKTQGVVNPEPR
jgi:hypothetical protein